jgi:ATP-binding cassette subfamily B protein
LPYPLLLVVVKYFSRQIIEGSLRVQQGLGELSTRVQENLSGIAVVQAYAREAHETRLFTALNDRFAAENMALARARGRLLPVMKLVASTGTVVVLWVGGRHVMAGILSIGDLFAFIGYLNMLAWPTMAMGWMLSVVQRGRAALQRLEDIFAAPAEIADRPGAVAPATTRGEVEFRGVDFAYRTAENGRPVLSGFDLRIPAGSTVAVVGRTAAGKSALVQLLPRLFDPTAGAVLLDGHDLRDLPLAWLRRQVTIVPQDPFLFSTTLRANIAFGVDPAAGNGVALDARVRQAAVAAGLERDLARLPKGLDTLVGERGVTLSGGQKQRVTLARALLTNPRVLVLDDALSSVDAETERAVLGHLAAYRRGRTSIIVAHRASTVRDADLIVVVDAGAIVERGTHEALLAQDGLYAELFRRQVLEEELERI